MADGHRTLRPSPESRAKPGGYDVLAQQNAASGQNHLLIGSSLKPDDESVRMVARPTRSAWLVHLDGNCDERSLRFAASLAADPALTVIVADIPQDVDRDFLPHLARAIPSGTSGLRIVFGRTPPGGAAEAAQWLATKLKRSICTAVGRPRPDSDGGLFISTDRGTGWMRYDARGGASWEGRRFPAPSWEKDLLDPPPQLGGNTAIEPIPSGVWLRPASNSPAVDSHRKFLTTRLRTNQDSMTVVVGAPGASTMRLTEIMRFWRTLPEHIQPTTRFVSFGPIELPPERRFDETFATWAGVPIRSYTGLPTSSTARADRKRRQTLFVQRDGSPGRELMAREIIQLPGSRDGESQPALVTGHEWPIQHLAMTGPCTYEHSPGTIIEVVPSGLWIRTQEEPVHARALRSRPAHATHEMILYDDSLTSAQFGHRLVAEEIAERVSKERPVVAVQVFSTREIDVSHLDELAPNPDPEPIKYPMKSLVERPALSSISTKRKRLRGLFDAQLFDDSLKRMKDIVKQHPELGREDAADSIAFDLNVLRLGILAGEIDFSSLQFTDAERLQLLMNGLIGGLEKLPSFRGAVALRVSLSRADIASYVPAAVIAESDFFMAGLSGNPGISGNSDIVIYSMTGRRTALLDTGNPDTVMFLPGSRFSVLGVEEGERTSVFLREIGPNDGETHILDRAAQQKLKRALLDWNRDEKAGVRPRHQQRLYFRPPGLPNPSSATANATETANPSITAPTPQTPLP